MTAPASLTHSTRRHTTHYLELGPVDGPLMVFLHGWPELGLIWRAQLEAFAADGWRCVAPDMRGYGGSSAPGAVDAYTQEQIVADMVELHDHLGGTPAVWVGHDWGSVVVGSLVSHEPRRCRGVVFVSVPYFPLGNTLRTLVPLVDRAIYPVDQYPDGQWDYFRYYNTHFASAVADLDADTASSLASIYRRANPAIMTEPAANASVTRKGGRFGDAHQAPPTAPDPSLWPADDFNVLVQSFEARGFRAPCAWYVNDDANTAYAERAVDHGRLTLPVLFVNGVYDPMNSINGNRLGDPMREACDDLTVTDLTGAHWLPVECKVDLVRALRSWLRQKELAPRYP
ncbi:alpha/beta fold hydrolase [Luteibacter yeojuensis]|uniref:Alpha/beta hydrolase n=1 Tax=Luteibacter yeojuensis TaxID=345309 RepID=A0A0F3L022_9GAMM|nr:alpha/beta hydrolase [Luteibacter yeojuensis]KJV35704.1 alpha/beta hydrolase [Luteibacter yeojuensis]